MQDINLHMLSPIIRTPGRRRLVWLRRVMLAVAGLLLLLLVARVVGHLSWNSRSSDLRSALEGGLESSPATFDPRELEGLPPAVVRMFAAVLTPGQPLVAEAHLKHEGEFDMGLERPNWRSFQSRQWVAARGQPGFVWDARIALLPWAPVHVHDAYVDARGILEAKLVGLVPLMRASPSFTLDQGELMRWVAEAAWYPTALLPSQGAEWSAGPDSSVRLAFANGRVRVIFRVRFDSAGRIASVRADDRYRETAAGPVPTPWEGRFWNYAQHDGMWVPMEGEVSWLLPEGPKPYWRGRVTELTYRFAR